MDIILCAPAIKIKAGHCNRPNCPKTASYGIPGTRKRLFCKNDAEDGMINVVAKRCAEPLCNISPSYNFKGLIALWCIGHALYGMINVITKRCEYSDCERWARFNFIGLSPLLCIEHSKPGMVRVKDKSCAEPGCNIIPCFNFIGLIAKWCFEHSTNEMVDVKNKQCDEPECTKQPKFNFAGLAALLCASHAKPGMIDVKSPQCAEPGCDTIPGFNYKGLSPMWCAGHAKKNMIDVKNNQCADPLCHKQPSHNFEGLAAIVCAQHAQPGMINVRSTRCKTPLCLTLVSNKAYKGLCLFCFINTPGNDLTAIYKNYKTKEKTVVDHVLASFPNVTWICDRPITDGCSKKRPDMFLDMGTHAIIIEIDENRHSGYSCENKRIMELSRDINHRDLIIIRFNPDSYKSETGTHVPSCWKTNRHGIFQIPKTRCAEWNNRMKTLTQQIQFWMTNPIPGKTLHIVQLFYGV